MCERTRCWICTSSCRSLFLCDLGIAHCPCHSYQKEYLIQTHLFTRPAPLLILAQRSFQSTSGCRDSFSGIIKDPCVELGIRGHSPSSSTPLRTFHISSKTQKGSIRNKAWESPTQESRSEHHWYGGISLCMYSGTSLANMNIHSFQFIGLPWKIFGGEHNFL